MEKDRRRLRVSLSRQRDLVQSDRPGDGRGDAGNGKGETIDAPSPDHGRLNHHGRVIAIGDVHGHLAALRALIDLVAPQPQDLIVTLGDYLDCGPDSKGVLDFLLDLERSLQLVPIRGNHEVMMSDARYRTSDLAFWKQCGGDWALRSYGGKSLDCIPAEHFDFLGRCVDDYEIDTHFFIHAGYWPNRRLSMQDHRTRYWSSLREGIPDPHFSGKIAVVGHTPQMDGRILNAGHLICVDTGCGYGGRLTALDVRSGEYWQVSETGEVL